MTDPNPKNVIGRELPWSDRSDYTTPKDCTCICGEIYQSQARKLPLPDEKDSTGKGISSYCYISFKPCPKCKNQKPVKIKNQKGV